MPIKYFKCQNLRNLRVFSWGKFSWTEMICVKIDILKLWGVCEDVVTCCGTISYTLSPYLSVTLLKGVPKLCKLF